MLGRLRAVGNGHYRRSIVSAISVAQAALWLGIYATVVSTAVGLLTLYAEVFQRVTIKASEGFAVPVQGGRMNVFGRQAADDLEVPANLRRPVLSLRVRNRGRRPVQIRTISKASWTATDRQVFDEVIRGVPFVVEPGHSKDMTLGGLDPYTYTHGELGNLHRFFVIDGADRIFPVRERWIQRVENVAWRRIRLRWKRRQRRTSPV